MEPSNPSRSHPLPTLNFLTSIIFLENFCFFNCLEFLEFLAVYFFFAKLKKKRLVPTRHDPSGPMFGPSIPTYEGCIRGGQTQIVPEFSSFEPLKPVSPTHPHLSPVRP
jgi:hypothetical protein